MKTKWKEGAYGPNEYMCETFVHDVAKEVYDVEAPDIREFQHRIIEEAKNAEEMVSIMEEMGLSRVDPEEEPLRAGDIVALSRFNNKFVDHLGIMVNGHQFAQMISRGPVISLISSAAYRRRIRGFYRCKMRSPILSSPTS